jgi:hypothetical protein
MSPNLAITILAIALAMHGAGHMLFLVPLIGLADWGQPTESWLFRRIGGCRAEQFFGTIIWLGATLGFIGAAIGLLFQSDWWRSSAILGAVISVIGLVLFWKNPPGSPVLAALIVDILVLVALLVFNWLPAF